jgi:hypothetical protein
MFQVPRTVFYSQLGLGYLVAFSIEGCSFQLDPLELAGRSGMSSQMLFEELEC